MAIAQLGGLVSFVGAVGDDANGKVLRDHLMAGGVDTKHLLEDPGAASGTACILVDNQAMNMIVVAPGANFSVSPEAVRASLRELDAAVVLAQLEIPLESVTIASDTEFFILNPAPACTLSEDLLSRCHILTPNETELEFLTGIEPSDTAACERAGHALLEKGVKNVVITLGSRGSFWVGASKSLHFPAPTVTPVDTTAAGDAFNGALAHFIAEGREIPNAIQLANCVGALATTRHGAQESMPARAELAALAGPLL